MSWKKFKQALRHEGPSYQGVLPKPLPSRGDDFERWLKYQRDLCFGHATTYNAVDGLLDEYRLHCDTGTPLSEHACDYACDCEGKEGPKWPAGE
jgi:hypothetical protein